MSWPLKTRKQIEKVWNGLQITRQPIHTLAPHVSMLPKLHSLAIKVGFAPTAWFFFLFISFQICSADGCSNSVLLTLPDRLRSLSIEGPTTTKNHPNFLPLDQARRFCQRLQHLTVLSITDFQVMRWRGVSAPTGLCRCGFCQAWNGCRSFRYGYVSI